MLAENLYQFDTIPPLFSACGWNGFICIVNQPQKESTPQTEGMITSENHLVGVLSIFKGESSCQVLSKAWDSLDGWKELLIHTLLVFLTFVRHCILLHNKTKGIHLTISTSHMRVHRVKPVQLCHDQLAHM